jgi:hypothetical protein
VCVKLQNVTDVVRPTGNSPATSVWKFMIENNFIIKKD